MIETTQPHRSSKALLESLAARDQETENPRPSASGRSQCFDLAGARLAQGKQSTQTLLLLRAPNDSILPAQKKPQLSFGKAILPIQD